MEYKISSCLRSFTHQSVFSRFPAVLQHRELHQDRVDGAVRADARSVPPHRRILRTALRRTAAADDPQPEGHHQLPRLESFPRVHAGHHVRVPDFVDEAEHRHSNRSCPEV